MSRAFSRRMELPVALVCAVVLLGTQLSVSAAAAGGQGSFISRRTLLQDAAPAAPASNATDIAKEALNTTVAAPNRTVATIFAPTDAAFEALAMALNLTSPLDLFNGSLNATAANITALHVVPGQEITTANLTATPNITVPSLLPGYNLTITKEPNGTVTVTVPGSAVVATVITPDVPYNGSIVHVIDKVLLPPANETAMWAVPLPASAEGV